MCSEANASTESLLHRSEFGGHAHVGTPRDAASSHFSVRSKPVVAIDVRANRGVALPVPSGHASETPCGGVGFSVLRSWAPLRPVRIPLARALQLATAARAATWGRRPVAVPQAQTAVLPKRAAPSDRRAVEPQRTEERAAPRETRHRVAPVRALAARRAAPQEAAEWPARMLAAPLEAQAALPARIRKAAWPATAAPQAA